MPHTNLPFEIRSASSNDTIYQEIGIDAEKLKNTLKLVKEWLNCESYLPTDIDELLLRNFILGCKGNIERIKEKLEKYLEAKTKITIIYRNRIVTKEDYFPYPHHRFICVCPKQTPEGNRILILKVPLKDATHFDHIKWSRYVFLVYDFLLAFDTSICYQWIYDVQFFSPQYLAKMNLGIAKQLCEVMYDTLPFRNKSINIVNNNSATEILMNIAKVFMSKKLKERISLVKTEDLPNYLPKECLPMDYGGTEKSYNDLSDELLEYMKENSEWCTESEKLKLIGPIPENRRKIYSYEDFNMDGSFRKLDID